jgi:N-acetylmuramoyl-L-alanine amidase
MARTVTAKDGDCVISLAKAAGFADWRTIYDHPENAALRRKRPDPSTLVAGDVVYLPDFQPLEVTLAAGSTYTIHTKAPHAKVDLLLSDPAGKPYKRKRYELKVGENVYKGRTSAEGKLKRKVPADAKEGELAIFLDDAAGTKVEFVIELGGLPPHDTQAGAQVRLHNLGYSTGDDERGKHGPGTERALRAFQQDQELPVTGELDAITRDRLRSEHKS